ncbi:unnamed protein product [Calicophoron daubneyi]|uniref:RING-type domain-containing protein n=1 Tax=Calicophoron daubneyi TaxID=300641 RepID=A0AAV2T640_CALDB
MHNFNLERIPLPQFSTYLIYTALSLIGSVVRLAYIISNDYAVPNSKGLNASDVILHPDVSNNEAANREDWHSVVRICVEDSWFFWNIINCAYCLFICVGRELQQFFFGDLRESELTHVRENFLNFLFYKIVFVYGILNVEALHEILLWITWFTILGFLILLTGLIKDRVEFEIQFLEQSSDKPVLQTRMLSLLFFVLFICNVLMAASVAIGTKYSMHLMFFMLAEVFQLTVRTIHVIAWYAIHLYSSVTNSDTKMSAFYQRSVSLYFSELIFSSVADCGDLVHNLHLLLWNNVRVNMSGIIIGMHLQHLYYKLVKRHRQHKRYRKVLQLIESQFPRVHQPNEDCAVCWEKLNDARQLPCGHIFHVSCLHMWIERSANCPVCRNLFDLDHLNMPVSNPVVHLNSPITIAEESQSGPSSADGQSSAVSQTSSHAKGDALAIKEGGTATGCEERSSCSNMDDNLFFPLRSHHLNLDSSVSAMVSINRFLEVSDQSVDNAEESENTNRSYKTALPNKFLDALEVELLNYFQSRGAAKRKHSHAASSDPGLPTVSAGTSELCSQQYDGELKACNSITKASGSTSNTSEQVIQVPSCLTSETMIESEEDTEFPPKRVLRHAIRHLLHRVLQAVGAAGAVDSRARKQYSPDTGSSPAISSDTESDSTETTCAELHPPAVSPSSSSDQCEHETSSDNGQWKVPRRHVYTHPIAKQKHGAARYSGSSCGKSHKLFCPISGTFHQTREERERSLEARKSGLLARARENFAQRHPSARCKTHHR